MIWNLNKGRGFSITEIIVVVAAVCILAVIVVVPLSSFRENQQLTNAVEETVSVISLARSKTLSSENFSQYGVHFETAKTVIFKGTVYSASEPDNIIFNMPSLIEISPSGSDVVFARITGKASNPRTVVLRVKNNTIKTKTIEIKSTGTLNVL